MYTYKEFKKNLIEFVKERYPEKKIRIEEITKINRKSEAMLLGVEDKTAIVIYLQDLYQEYNEHDNWEGILKKVIQIAEMPMQEMAKVIIGSWEEEKGRIYPVIVGREKNLEQMIESDAVFREKLDFLILYYLKVMIPGKEEMTGSIKITEELLKKWKVSEETLYKQCFENEDYVINEFFDMRALTNRNNYRGAAGMFFSNQIRKLAEQMGCNLYILPSSVHEVILLEQNENLYNVEELKEMVRSINADKSIITEEDYLSDSVYLYNRETDTIRIAA